MTKDYTFRVESICREDRTICVVACGVNLELVCREGMIQMRKCPTGILVEESPCPRKPETGTIIECLDSNCTLLNNAIPVPEKEDDYG